jgi:L-asparaginase II
MIELIQRRGACDEVALSASVAVVQGGALVALRGDDRVTTFRSAAKPFQLAVSLEALGDPPFDDEDLAVGAASHSAEPVHVARVEALLRRFGLDVTGLLCGAHAPAHTPSAEAVIRAGGAYTALHNNCSGKHTFMLAACARQGWDADYLPPEHPYQRRVLDAVSGWMSHTPYTVTDGCGVPTFCQPLSAAARGWWQIAHAMAAEPDGRLGRIGHAMARHPAAARPPKYFMRPGALVVGLDAGLKQADLAQVGHQPAEHHAAELLRAPATCSPPRATARASAVPSKCSS